MPLDDTTGADGGGAPRPRGLAARSAASRLGVVLGAGLATLLVARSVAVAYAEERVREELAALGLDGAAVTVRSVGLGELVLGDVRLGPDLTARSIVLRYGAGDLVDGRIAELELGGLRWELPTDLEALPRSTPARLFATLLAGLPFLGGCISQHSVHMEPIQLEPIHVTMDVNVRVQNEAAEDTDDEVADDAGAPTEAH